MNEATRDLIDLMVSQIDKGYWKGDELRGILERVHVLGFAEGAVFGAQQMAKVGE